MPNRSRGRARSASALSRSATSNTSRKRAGGMDKGLRGQPLLRALDALAELAPSPILGVVYGAGFEDRPELLTLIARHWPLLGNKAMTVARLKAPESFFAELDRLGIPPT